MINFLHSFSPESILLKLGIFTIHWYGLFIVIGIFLAIFISVILAKKYNISSDFITDLAFWLIIGGVIGARIYHILLELPYYLQNPIKMIKIWEGGIAIHGAIFAGLTILYFYSKQHKTSPILVASIITPGLALGQALGRWGNYFNQELFGLPTTLPWGIPIDLYRRPLDYINSVYFHPTFLYESILNFLLFTLLLSIHYFIIKKGKFNHYFTISIYFFGYSIIRFLLEFVRIDPTPEFYGLKIPQIASLFIIVGTIIFLILKNRKKLDKNKETC